MMTVVQFYEFDSNDVRTIAVDGAPWFVAADVALILGYKRPAKAAQDHVDIEDRRSEKVVLNQDKSQVRRMTVVNESGLYSLIFGSELPEAKRFKRWVTSEVLPAIRRDGAAIHPDRRRFTDADIEAGVQRQLQKRQYKTVVRDSLRAIGDQPGWQYGQVHNTILTAITGMSAPETLESGREIRTFAGEAPTAAERKVATNYLFADELERFNLITDAVSVDLRFHKPTSYRQFLYLVREVTERYTRTLAA